MKYLSLAPLPTLAVALVLSGCGHKSEFDITPAQAQNRVIKSGPGGAFDMKHLPPGAVKHEKMFHKGDKMPDGTIADGDRKMVTIEMNK